MSSDLDVGLLAVVVFLGFIFVSFVYGASVGVSHAVAGGMQYEERSLMMDKCSEKFSGEFGTAEVSGRFACFNRTQLITPRVSISELYHNVSGLQRKLLWPGTVALSLPAYVKIPLYIGAVLGLFFLLMVGLTIASGKPQRL